MTKPTLEAFLWRSLPSPMPRRYRRGGTLDHVASLGGPFLVPGAHACDNSCYTLSFPLCPFSLPTKRACGAYAHVLLSPFSHSRMAMTSSSLLPLLMANGHFFMNSFFLPPLAGFFKNSKIRPLSKCNAVSTCVQFLFCSRQLSCTYLCSRQKCIQPISDWPRILNAISKLFLTIYRKSKRCLKWYMMLMISAAVSTCARSLLSLGDKGLTTRGPHPPSTFGLSECHYWRKPF